MTAKKHDYQVVADLTRQGLSIKDIAAVIGRTPHQVGALKEYAKNVGVLERKSYRQPQYERVAALMVAGATVGEVAQTLGISRASVYRAKRIARDNGALPEFKARYDRQNFNIGSLTKALAMPSKAIVDQMRADTPEGSTIAEMLVEMYMDKYFEERASKIAAE